MIDTPREPDARDPTASRGDGGEAGIEQPDARQPEDGTSEDGAAEPTAAALFDEEGAGLAAKE